jgi:phosphatidylglycerophosphatase A
MKEPSGKVYPQLLWHPLGLLAFGFGSGLVPVAPGTAGTLTAVPLYLLLRQLPPEAYVATVALLFLLGLPVCGHAARRLGVHDHPAIVWDEIVGYLAAMTCAPPGTVWMVAGFVLFRFFDILKPWPIRWCDRRVHGGFGIMLDDLLAGLFTAALLQIAARWLA